MKYALCLLLVSLCWCDTTSVNYHKVELSHHINARSAVANDFDWFLNLDGRYLYDKGIKPDLILYGSTERDHGVRYNEIRARTSSEYYFADKLMDEERDVDIFSAGVYYKFFWIKHGYSYLENKNSKHHGIYHEFKNKWLLVELHYLNEIYKLNFEVNYKQSWKYNLFGSLTGNYLILGIDEDPVWNIGYKIGWNYK